MSVENKDIKVIRTNVNCPELQDDLSLWKIAGQESIIEILKNTVLSYFADKEIGRDVQLPSIILSGLPGLGRRTIARALINSLGITDCRECLGRTVGMGGEATIDVFENAADNSSIFVQGGEAASRFVQETFYKLLTTNKIYIPEKLSCTRTIIEFDKRPLVIFSCKHTSTLFPELMDVFDLHLTLTNYSPDEIVQILSQRKKWLGWKCENDEVLKMIAEKAEGNPGQSMKLFQMAYTISRAKDKDIMDVEDVEKAVGLLGKKMVKGA